MTDPENEVLSAYVTIRYYLPNLIDRAALNAMYMGSLDRCVRSMAEEESIGGLADSDGTIVAVEPGPIDERYKP